LPEINTGWSEASGVVGVREGALLRDVLLLPLLLPRCAGAAVASHTMTINVQALKKEELLIATSVL
jgi:ABC-type transport system involved in cytochrome c biogenesis permease component